jgi:hypothetical protein
MVFILVEDQKLEFDLSKVTHVEEVHSLEPQLIVYFIGGVSVNLGGWSLKKWHSLRDSAIRQMQLKAGV